MSRSVKITAWCDGQKQHPPDGKGQPYRPGQFMHCTKTLEASSHKRLSEKIERCGWIEGQSGILKCNECLAREAAGEIMRFAKRQKAG